MDICDFERSYVRFRVDTEKKQATTVSRKLPMTLNNVRIPLECRAQITDIRTGETSEYVLSASCKAEQVWVEKDIWHQPNADMCGFASKDQFLICKQWDKYDKGVMRYPESLGVQPERQLVDPAEAFDQFSVDIRTRPGRGLTSISEIVEVLFSEKPVISRTEYQTGDYKVMLEYPVKTFNVSERENYYQVDTGPVIYPDFSQSCENIIECLQKAYIAHNCPEWAELIVNCPTPLNETISVYHFSKSVRIDDAKNSLFEVI